MECTTPSPHQKSKEEREKEQEERERKWRNERAKHKRERKKEECQRVIDHNFDTDAFSPEKNRLLFFTGFLEKLKVEELKELCRISSLMVGGTKKILTLRLARAKFHGAPGKCPVCQQSKLEFTYPDDDLVSLPCQIRCKHLHGEGKFCKFSTPTVLEKTYMTDESTARFSNPLVDNENKTLSQIDKAVAIVLGEPPREEEGKVDEDSDDDATSPLIGSKRKRISEDDEGEEKEVEDEGVEGEKEEEVDEEEKSEVE